MEDNTIWSRTEDGEWDELSLDELPNQRIKMMACFCKKGVLEEHQVKKKKKKNWIYYSFHCY